MATPPLPTSAPLSGDLPPVLRRGVLALWTLLLLVPASRILAGLPVYGDDHSSHMAAVHHLLALIRAGESDLFCPTFNLGFPMYLYYQGLPHLVVAAVHLLSLGLIGEQAAFNLTLVALWCCYPLCVYAGARRLQLGDTAALIAALCAPLVSSALPFGFTLHSVMGLGLFTQTQAMVLLPLCLGWTWHALGPGARGWQPAVAAAGLNALVWLSHGFYGMAAATAALLMVLVAPSRVSRSLPRLLAIGLLVLASLAFWLVPLALTREFMGGWPWGGADRWQGYGVVRVATELVTGQLFDQRHLPVLTLGALLGIVVAVRRWRDAVGPRFLLVAFGLVLFFLMGRRTFGHLVDIQPANLGVQLFRYIGPVHLFGVLLAALGLAWLFDLARRRLPLRGGHWVLGALLFVSPCVHLGYRSAGLFRDIRSYSVGVGDLERVGGAIRAARAGQVPPGRIYSHTKSGHGSHLVAALLAVYTDQPLGQSYGVGLHDSLGFYYLEYLDPSRPVELALYNFRYLVARPGGTLARLGRPLLELPHLRLRALTGRYGYFQAVDLELALVGEPRQIRPAALRWLRSDLPAAGSFGVVVPTQNRVPAAIRTVWRAVGDEVQTLRGNRWIPLEPPVARPVQAPAGDTLSETVGLNRYAARVRMRRAGALALKVSFHPFWQVEVDGRPARSLMLTPSFLGVRLPAGEHRVVFSFRNPTYQKILALLALLLWAGLGVVSACRARAGGDKQRG